MPTHSRSVLFNLEPKCKRGSEPAAPTPNRIQRCDFAAAAAARLPGRGGKAGTGARPNHGTGWAGGQELAGARPLLGGSQLSWRDLPPKLNFNPGHKSSRSVPCPPPPPPGSPPAAAGRCGHSLRLRVPGHPACLPWGEGQSYTDRPGGPAGHRALGLAKGPACRPGRSSVSSAGGPEGLARVPGGPWVALLSERPGSDHSPPLPGPECAVGTMARPVGMGRNKGVMRMKPRDNEGGLLPGSPPERWGGCPSCPRGPQGPHWSVCRFMEEGGVQ